MRWERFWELIELARADATAVHGDLPDSTAISKTLEERLARLELDEIIAFDHCFGQATGRVHRWEICAATLLIEGWLSDDGFADFKAGLVGLGQAAFERIADEPDLLAEHPLVLAMVTGEIDRYALSGELLGYAAIEAYERRTGDPEKFWADRRSIDRPDSVSDTRWSGRFGTDEDGDLIPQKLPRLHALCLARKAMALGAPASRLAVDKARGRPASTWPVLPGQASLFDPEHGSDAPRPQADHRQG